MRLFEHFNKTRDRILQAEIHGMISLVKIISQVKAQLYNLTKLQCINNKLIIGFEYEIYHMKIYFTVSDLKRRCVQTATSIFQLADRRIAIPFLQAMAPPIIQV